MNQRMIDRMANSIYSDTFYTVSPEDSDLWMDLFMYADILDPYFAGVLQYLRNTGTKLVKDERFGYRLVPVIGADGWESMAQYKQETEYLKPYRNQLILILKKLGGKT